MPTYQEAVVIQENRGGTVVAEVRKMGRLWYRERSSKAVTPLLSGRWKQARWLVFAVALFALLGFGATVLWARGAKLSSIELTATMKFQTIRAPYFYRLMTLVSAFGYAPLLQLLWAGAIGLLLLSGRRLEGLFAAASAGATAIVVVVKRLVGRPRPSGPGVRVAVAMPDFGFPSGHTVHYVSFFGFLAYLAATHLRPAVLRRLVVALSAALIFLVGPSRVYLGQHWLSDVVAAYLFGSAYLAGLVEVYETVRAMRSRRSSR